MGTTHFAVSINSKRGLHAIDTLVIIGLCYFALVGLVIFAGRALHQYSLKHHSYTPFEMVNIVLAVVMTIALGIGLFVLWGYDGWSGYVLLGLAAILAGIIFYRSLVGTNTWIASSATFIYLIGSALCIIAFVVYKLMTAKSESQSKS